MRTFVVWMVISLVIAFLPWISSSVIAAAEEEGSAKPQSIEGQAGQIIEHETGFYYIVQKGDTLWDLSQRFADTPWLWPEMWQENRQIRNPHRIYPGQRIRLYRRTGKQRLAGMPSDQGRQKELKPSLKELIRFNYSKMDRIGFIRKTAIEPQGTIFKVQETRKMISEGDIIYIQPQKETMMSPGKRFTIYRTLQPIRDRKTGDYIGIQHYLTGIAEISRIEPKYVIARVVDAYRPIKLGDLLMPYRRRVPSITLLDSPEELEAKVIDSEEHQYAIGDETIVFMDRGYDDGVRPGQFYHLYHQEEEELPLTGERVTLARVEFGELLVLHTEKTTATVLITYAEHEFYPGTKIHAPRR